jgi:hypothetical protein
MTAESTESKSVKAAGYSATKIHWQNVKIHGVQTSCKKRLSGGGDDNKSFYWTAKNYRESVCEICLNKFKEYVKQKIDNKSK